MNWTPQSGAFRPLLRVEAHSYAGHLKRLPARDLHARFRRAMTAEALDAHADQALSGGGHVIGWFYQGELRAAAEAALIGDGSAAEGAFEVETAFRGRGVGSELIARCLLWARNRGARSLYIFTERANVPMLTAARREGAQFTFDLNDAEGQIAARRPHFGTYLREFEEAERGWLDWGFQRFMATAQKFNPWRTGPPDDREDAQK